MKFVKELVTAGTHIPAAALYLSGLGDSERLELHTLDGASVLLRGGMTAAELLTTAQSLHTLSMELVTHLGPAPAARMAARWSCWRARRSPCRSRGRRGTASRLWRCWIS